MRPCGSVVVHYNRRVDQPEASAMKAKYSWTWAGEYSHLSAELAASSGRDFEKQALPSFVRLGKQRSYLKLWEELINRALTQCYGVTTSPIL
jgi:hypothetical protein